MIKLLVLDLDGTLYNSKAEVDETNRLAILAAEKKNVRVALASGRPYYGLNDTAKLLELDHYNGFIIGNNGQELYDYKTKTLSKGKKIPQKACHQVFEIAKQENLETFVHNDNRSMYYSPIEGDKYHPEKKTRGYNEELGYFVEDCDYDKIGFFIAPQRNDALALGKRMQEAIGDQAQVMVVNAECVELVPTGLDKVNGIDAIVEKYGFSKEEVLVMGDGQNDLQMAYHYPFVAMANALEEVKKVALRITSSNDECGVAQEIEKSILIQSEKI